MEKSERLIFLMNFCKHESLNDFLKKIYWEVLKKLMEVWRTLGKILEDGLKEKKSEAFHAKYSEWVHAEILEGTQGQYTI